MNAEGPILKYTQESSFGDPEIEKSWIIETQRRHEECKSGKVKLLSEEEFHRKLNILFEKG